MKHIRTNQKRGFFDVLMKSGSVQAAMMTLGVGQSSSDDVENEHPSAEQWVFVIAGSGKAKVGERTIKLSAGSLLLIEKRELHQIMNTGRGKLRTVNFYSPPAYGAGDEITRRAASK